MKQSVKATNVKNEPTDSISSDRIKIPSQMHVKDVKQESDFLVQSEIDIKSEPQEDEAEFMVIASTSYDLCPNYEPIIKIEYENVLDQILQDPLHVSSEIKVETQLASYLDQAEPKIKTEPTEEEKDENLLESDENFDSHGNASNLSDQLLNRINVDRSKYKTYICKECNKIFGHKSHLDRHLRIHTGEKPFTCSICKKSFTEKGTLDRHMIIHSDEKPHSCDLCKKVFRHKLSLDSHRLIHDGVKPFSCDVCDKSFRVKQDLVRHKRVHTGEKTYICDLCKKTFNDKSNLNRHKHIHTIEKPYSCDICNKPFTQKSNLDRHKKIHKQ